MIRKVFLVIACIFLHMLSSGMILSFGVLYREMRVEFGTSHSEAAWIASIYNGLTGFVGIPLGLIANRIGERWPTVCGSVLLALGMLTSMFATQISTVYVTYGLLAGSGAGITDYCAYTVLAQHFNDRWRPVAVTFASAGIPLGALMLPPILTVLIEQFSWRKAFMVLACLSLLGVLASLCFFLPKKTMNSQAELITDKKSNRTLSKFLKNSNFTLYVTSSFVVCLVVFAPATFLPDLLYEFNSSSSDVYVCVMTMGSCDLAARVLMGFLAQWKPIYLALIHSAGAMILCVSSVLITFSRSIEAFVLMSGLVGLGTGWFAGLFFFMTTHLLPAEDVRFGFGILLTFSGLAFVVGMPLAGFVTDFFDTERGSFIFSSVLFFIGSLLEFIIGIRKLCKMKFETKCVIAVEVNTVDIADEELQGHIGKINDVDIEESSHI